MECLYSAVQQRQPIVPIVLVCRRIELVDAYDIDSNRDLKNSPGWASIMTVYALASERLGELSNAFTFSSRRQLFCKSLRRAQSQPEIGVFTSWVWVMKMRFRKQNWELSRKRGGSEEDLIDTMENNIEAEWIAKQSEE